jgi:hypothetical protein
MKTNVWFILGPHSLTSERIESINLDLSEKYGTIEVKRCYGSEFDSELFINEITEASLFLEYKIVIVHQMEEIDKKTWENVIFPFLKKIPENIFVIFEGISIKVKTGDYTVEHLEEEENLRKKIFKKSWKKRLNAKDIYEISQFLKMYPYEFASVIGVIEKYLQNLFLSKAISEQAFLEKIKNLSDIDFKLKSGRIPNEPGWEVLLLNLLDISC